MSADRSSALRPLHAAAERLELLRSGRGDAGERTRALLDLAAAVEWTLRRLLRDDPLAPLEARLSALAPEELRVDEVLSELRQHDRITIQLAASVHHLLEIRERLRNGGLATPEEVGHGVSTVDLVETEQARGVPERPPVTEQQIDETIHEVPSPSRRDPRALAVAGGAVLLGLVLLFLIFRLVAGGGRDANMEQGVALFRSGSYADAAHHFHRYAERNPRDATPHLYLARIHRRMNRPDLAGPALQEAMRLAPDDAAVHRELGFLLIDTRRYDVAVERFRTAVAMDANAAEGWLGLVLALRRDGRPDEAERVLARAPVQVREQFERQAGPPALEP
jgi:tetratricopeptide (TPR) repeat protein